LNDSGQAAFYASLDGTPDGSSDNSGIFRGDGTTLVQIARKGQVVPDGNGVLSDMRWTPASALNSRGQIVFWADISGTNSGASDDAGIFYGDGASLVQVARRGDAAPDGNATFSSFANPMLNESGQVAFQAYLLGRTGQGIFLFDKSAGLTQVARTGDSFLGSTISTLIFIPGGARGSGVITPVDFSKTGIPRIAYKFRLADGRTGIALWTLVPEPGSLLIAGIGAIAIWIVTAWPLRKSPWP